MALSQQHPDSAPASRPTGSSLHDSIPSLARSVGWLGRERGFSVGTIDADSGASGDASTLPLALQARIPGVSVTQGEGILGASSRVWLRGPRSVTIDEPLLIIDGVRTHGSAVIRGFAARPLPSRLEDIDMEVIERIEVLRGPAAAAMYGTSASKGVILVTTSRPSEGPARWAAFAESGPSMEVTRFPANFGTTGISTGTGAPLENCPLAQQAAGSCLPLARRSWNPLEAASPFRTGWTNSAGARVSGGGAGVAWNVAASHDRAEGVYETDRSRATNGHVSVSASPTAGTDVRLTATHRIDRLRHPLESIVGAGLFGAAADDPDTRGYAPPGDYRYLTSAAQDEDVDRTTVGLSTRWSPRSWLRTGLTLGYDRFQVDTDYRVRQPQFSFPEPSTDTVTRTAQTTDRPEARSASLDGTLSYRTMGLDSRSTVGLQYLREDDWGTSAGSTISEGGGGSASYESVYDMRRSSSGAYLEQHVGWNDRLFVTGSIRMDRPRIMDVSLETMVSRAIDVSWIALEAGRGGAPAWLGELRLRGAYGAGGDQLLVGQPFSFSGPPGPPALETTERGSEVEVGADALIGRHLRASVTYFTGTTTRGLVAYETFQGPAIVGAAEVGSSGLEGSIDSRLLELGGFAWDARLALSRRSSEIESMGLPAFIVNGQRLAAGRPLGEYMAAPYSFADLDGDGLIAPGEVTVLSNEFGPVGTPYPDFEASLGTTLSLGSRVQVSALLDHRSGMTLYNQMARLRCRTRCAEQHDPATPLDQQARSVAASQGGEISYYEDGSFTKLREVRLSVGLPASVARMGGASGARISITGRNLQTWTDFTGLDPEILSPDVPRAAETERFLQPPLRSFTARLDVAW